MGNKMKAAVYEGGKELVVKEVDMPEIVKDSDVLLRVKAAAICTSDMHVYFGAMGADLSEKLRGRIPGHEYMGDVYEVGKGVDSVKPGDRVLVNQNIHCGVCDSCRIGAIKFCKNMIGTGFMSDGGFAEYNVVPAKALYRVRKDLPPEEGALTEPLSCVVNGVSKAGLIPCVSVVVLGGGPIGQMYVKLLRFIGAGKIMVSEPSDYRKEFCLRFGADRVINPFEEDIVKEVKSEMEEGAEVVIDTVGSLLITALKLVTPNGTIVLFGIAKDGKGIQEISQMDISSNYEIEIKASFISGFNFPIAVRLIERNALNIGEVISHKLKLSEINKGIELLRKLEANKVIIYP